MVCLSGYAAIHYTGNKDLIQPLFKDGGIEIAAARGEQWDPPFAKDWINITQCIPD